MLKRVTFIVLFLCSSLLPAWGIGVASLHPLMTDLARQIGGDKITVIELVGPNDDPHSFDPKPETLRRIRDARLILASGKGLEASYMGDLKDGLREDQEVFEVGRRVPSLVPSDANIASCCAHHMGSIAIDPHWWHDVQYMRRAARYLANEFARIDPENADFYQANAHAYRRELSELHDWVRREVSTIPRNKRVLGSSHMAFGYFCQAYDFKALSIQGIHKDSSPSAAELMEIIRYIREENIPILFPEYDSNPKALEQIVQDAGIQLGGALYADGVALPDGEGYIYMMRHNVNTIVSALGQK